jgi:hypothetical protein
VVSLIALIFSGAAWWIIFIIIIVVSMVGWILKSSFRLMKALFQKRQKYRTEHHGLRSEFKPYEQPTSYESKDEEDLITNSEEHIEDTDVFTFHCWKCGEEIEVNLIGKPDTVGCWNCGTNLSVPKE